MVNNVTSLTDKELQGIFKKPLDRFINRELSWLAFNERVLDEALNPANPLLERVKFLSISSSNLDEFYMVRIAGLKEQVKNNVSRLSIDGLTPKEQLTAIRKRSDKLIDEQVRCWKKIKEELKKNNIFILNPKSLSKKEFKWLKTYYFDNIFPALSPIAIDPAHPFPFMPNLGVAIVIEFADEISQQDFVAMTKYSIIPLPAKLERFIKLPSPDVKELLLVEDVIYAFREQLFPGREIKSYGMIRILRDSDLEIEEEAEDLVTNFESAVKRRRRGSVIRLKASNNIPLEARNFIIKELNTDPSDVLVSKYIGLSNIMELYSLERPDLKYPSYDERFPERINDYSGDCFAAIAAKDIVIHHPYETFDVVVRFLNQAASDPDVVAIKQTLYRTSNNSPIVKALIAAAEAGKSVVAVVELKARFDEEANIRWARDLERAGAQVVFGFVELKTHAKLSLVVRREKTGLKSYVHIGTGNYHPVTAKIYTDLSFFTSDPELCLEASYVFNFLTGYSPPKNFNKIAMSPISMRPKIVSLIEAEIANAKEGKPAFIWAKMNALIDKDIIDLLYKASQAGVKIDLVIRGICGLRPGIKGFSDNITVKSIVGRFLEHSRICCFGNGHALPSRHAKVFIASADWMPRNFNGRVEILVPIENPTVHEQILDQIMVANLKDQKQSWIMQKDGTYKRVECDKDAFSAHEYFMKNPSLSGRGKALHGKDQPDKPKDLFKILSFNRPEE